MRTLKFTKNYNDALNTLEQSREHIFLTGNAGTGKSTILEHFRGVTKKKIVLLAPTGVAALTIGGQTIHSFFGFGSHIVPDKVRACVGEKKILINALDTIIIDEVSMLRSDLLDAIDRVLQLTRQNKKEAFGGIQIIFVGDLYQLPPVVTREERQLFIDVYKSPYFFDANVFSRISFLFLYLQKNYRQYDELFMNTLNALRYNMLDFGHKVLLDSRVKTDNVFDYQKFSITLTPTNNGAENINKDFLENLPHKKHIFTASVGGSFSEKNYPTQERLILKIGAQVMFLNNDRKKRWVNGSIGRIDDVIIQKQGCNVLRVRLSNGKIVSVLQHMWEIFTYSYNKKTRQISSESVGHFEQYPLTLAWAITIHKSQGKTFDHMIIDLGNGAFAHGQSYVALSRVRSLSGLILKKRLSDRDIIIDSRVSDFFKTSSCIQKAISLKESIVSSLTCKYNILNDFISSKQSIDITFISNKTLSDECSIKSYYKIKPLQVGIFTHNNQTYHALFAFDENLKQKRVFPLDFIISINSTDSD